MSIQIPIYTAEGRGRTPDASAHVSSGDVGGVAFGQEANKLVQNMSQIYGKLNEQQADVDFLQLRSRYDASVNQIITDLQYDPTVMETPGKFVEEFRSRVRIIVPDLLQGTKNGLAQRRLQDYINAKGPLDQAEASKIGAKLFTVHIKEQGKLLRSQMAQEGAEAYSKVARELAFKTYSDFLDDGVNRQVYSREEAELEKRVFNIEMTTKSMETWLARDRGELYRRNRLGEFDVVPPPIRAEVMQKAISAERAERVEADNAHNKIRELARGQAYAYLNRGEFPPNWQSILDNKDPYIRAEEAGAMLERAENPPDDSAHLALSHLANRYALEKERTDVTIQKYRTELNDIAAQLPRPSRAITKFGEKLHNDERQYQNTVASQEAARRSGLGFEASDLRRSIRETITKYRSMLPKLTAGQLLNPVDKAKREQTQKLIEAEIATRLIEGETPGEVLDSILKRDTTSANPITTPGIKANPPAAPPNKNDAESLVEEFLRGF